MRRVRGLCGKGRAMLDDGRRRKRRGRLAKRLGRQHAQKSQRRSGIKEGRRQGAGSGTWCKPVAQARAFCQAGQIKGDAFDAGRPWKGEASQPLSSMVKLITPRLRASNPLCVEAAHKPARLSSRDESAIQSLLVA